jgi:class 3 adenylate cyclase/ketosteroid isomerase-like protein
MRCPSCQHENRDGAKFCEECATPLKRACTSCATELRPTAKFCDECGTPIPAAGARGATPSPTAQTPPQAAPGGAQRAEGERSSRSEGERSSRTVVSIIFADLVGSTSLHERLDAEAVSQFMEAYYAAMRGAVEAHGGRVTQVMGDGVKAVFGVPRVAEDDAIRAVRAGVAMQEAFKALFDEQRERVGRTGLRVAVNTGEVVSDGETEIIGDPVNVAARLQEQGGDGDVVIGGSTQRIVASLVTLELLGTFALKGRTVEVEAYRVVSLEPPAATRAAFVGRTEELRRIEAVYEDAIAKPETRLAVLLGSPGLGKTRLLDELVERRGNDAKVFSAHCDTSGGGTFAPIAAALRFGLGLEEETDAAALEAAIQATLSGDDAEHGRIAAGIAALLTGSPSSPEETFFVVRRLLAVLASAKPVVLVIDDLQWAEPLLLDLVEHLVQWGSGVPLLVLVGARPELRDLRSSLVTPGGSVSEVLTLAGLDAGAAMQLAAGVIGASDLPAALAGKLLAASEGNPLFVAELIKMLVQEGVLTQEGDRWVASSALADLEMPPTIQALLAARIERLAPEERTVLERAAVVGRSFSRSAVASLLRETGDLDARLEALRRSELIESDAGWFLGEPRLRFHHVLIRDAAYRRVLKGTRAELHARLAGWIEAQVGDAAEHDETVGRHLEQAHQHLRELGPLDEDGVALGERAARRLAPAGRRALTQDDVALAAGLLGRAIDCLPTSAPDRADLVLDWCEAVLSAGDVGTAATAIGMLAQLSEGSERLRAWHTCFAGHLTTLTDPDGLQTTAPAVAAAAQELARLEDAAGEAKGHFVHAQALARLGQVGACEAALDQALAAARRVDDRRLANAVLTGAPRAALWGPSPVTRASGRCLDVVRVLRITQGAPAVEAVALSCQGVLEALRGRTDAAKRMIASAREMVEELGIAHRVHETDVFAGRVALLEDDPHGAERFLRGAYDGLRSLGLGIDAAQAAALLARALLAQGRADEADVLSRESEALAGDDLQAAIAWRGARAEALAQRGAHAEAVAVAQAGVEIAAATDALLDHADARMAAAAALRAAGRSSEADAEERRARELWQEKGATLLQEHSEATPDAQAPGVALPTSRRVVPNLALESCAWVDQVTNARDWAALATFMGPGGEEIHHPTGSHYDRDGAIRSAERLMRSRDVRYRTEPLATLGTRLLLGIRHIAASGTGGGRFDVGPYTGEFPLVFEVDAAGKLVCMEVFGPDRLGDALVNLYQRYAALLPEGPEHSQAAEAVRTFGALAQRFDIDRVVAAMESDVGISDQRSVGNVGELQGAEEVRKAASAMLDLTEGFDWRIRDVVAASDRALLVRRDSSGRQQAGGGDFERSVLELWVLGESGRVGRWERFEPGDQPRALERFDALTGGAPAAPRRVRPNPASALAARFEAVFVARDVSAIEALWSDELVVIHHPTGSEYGKEGHLRSLRKLAEDDLPELRIEPLATLGDSLVLTRRSLRARATEGRLLDVGDWERSELVIFELADSEHFGALELFAADKLSDALMGLYGRYAENPPAGASAGPARVLADILPSGRLDVERIRASCHPDIAFVDHRTLGFGSAKGAEAFMTIVETLGEASPDSVQQTDEILAVEPNGALLRIRNAGTDRATGGSFERHMLRLFISSAGGTTHVEQFDLEAEREAVARFRELTGGGPADPGEDRFANAAARTNASWVSGFANQDWPSVEASVAATFVFDDRRSLRHLTLGRADFLIQFRGLFDTPGRRLESERIATRGERLSLHRHRFTGQTESGGDVDFGWHLAVCEVDEEGRFAACIPFDLEDEAAAWAELDARYEAGEAGRHWHQTRSIWEGIYRRDREAILATLSPDFRCIDHRRLGWGETLDTPEKWFQSQDSLVELSPDMRYRADHFMVRGPAFLAQVAQVGTRDGGPFENAFVFAAVLDEQDRISYFELYDVDRLDTALARFEEIAAPARPAPRFETPATRASDRLATCWAARDWESYAACLSPTFRLDDRRSAVQLDVGRDEFLQMGRHFGDMGSTWTEARILATRGERLALARVRIRVADGDVGASDLEHLNVVEVDDRGQIGASARYDADDIDAALADLDARYEAGEAGKPWYQTQRNYAAVHRRDREGILAALAPDFSVVDHRRLGWGRTLDSPEKFAAAQDSLLELAPDTRYRCDHFLDRGSSYLTQVAQIGTRDGGAFENPLLYVGTLSSAGRLAKIEVYDCDQIEAAFARFDEIAAPGTASGPFENAATRLNSRLIAAWREGDWDTFAAGVAPSGRFIDRRPMFRVELSHEQFVASARQLGEMESAQIHCEILATRGDRLALNRLHIEVSGGDVGVSDVIHLNVVEADEQGLNVAQVRFEPDDLEAAFAELDERYAASDESGLWRVNRDLFAAAFRRDQEACLAALAPDFFVDDRRQLGFGKTLDTPESFYRSQESLVELAPDTRLRVDHFATGGGAYLCQAAQVGTRDGGAYERVFVYTGRADPQGRLTHFDAYDPERVADARARFEALAAEGGPLEDSPFTNDAFRALQRIQTIWGRRDWEGFAAQLSADFHGSDRRRLVQLEMDGPEFTTFTSQVGDRATGADIELLATRGERLALFRVLTHAADETVGPSELESLLLVGTNARDEIHAFVRFDAEDIDDAYHELETRFVAGEGAGFGRYLLDFGPALGRRDWEALADSYAPGFVARDHRLTGFGTRRGAEEFMAAQRAMVELAPDARVRAHHIRQSGRVRISQNTWMGTRDGGAFEIPLLAVVEIDDDGRNRRMEIFEIDRLDAAYALFHELARASASEPQPALVPTGPAAEAWNRAMRTLLRAIESGDWDELRALARPDVVMDDRTRMAQVTGGRDMMIESLRARAETGARPTATLLGTAGDRVAIGRSLWSGGPSEGRFEIEFFGVFEFDEDGREIAVVLFDDARAAQQEAWRRWAAREPASRALTEVMGKILDHSVSKDRVATRHEFAEDLIVVDHRRTGMGRVDGREAYVSSIHALWDLAPGGLLELGWTWPAWGAHGGITEARFAGTLVEGGAFESLFLYLFLVGDGRITHLELFEHDALPAALARFHELAPASATPTNQASNPFDLPPNLATRAAEAAADIAVRRELVTPDFRFEDRQTHAQLKGDVETWIESGRYVVANAEVTRVLVCTLGDRIALYRAELRGGPDRIDFAHDNLTLFETDADGKLCGFVLFAGDHYNAAYREAQLRFEAGEAATLGAAHRPILALNEAVSARDWDTFMGLFTPDALIRDHRRLGFGRLDPERWRDSLRALTEIAPDLTVGPLRLLAWNERGRVNMTRAFGHGQEDAAFENLSLAVILIEGERIRSYEAFDLEDVDRALARFEELCGG